MSTSDSRCLPSTTGRQS